MISFFTCKKYLQVIFIYKIYTLFFLLKMKLLIAFVCVLILIYIVSRVMNKKKPEEPRENSKIDLLIKDIEELQNA